MGWGSETTWRRMAVISAMPDNDLTPERASALPAGCSGVDSGADPADDRCMRVPTAFRRAASAGLALVVLVSSLTCMTVACRVVCADGKAPQGLGTATTAPADLPPCHRAAAADHGGKAKSRLPAGDCNAGTVCCSTWLHEKDTGTLPAPVLVRGPLVGDAPADIAAAIALRARLDKDATGPPALDSPAPPLEVASSPRASRAPPAA